MRARSERNVFKEILSYTSDELRVIFDFIEEDGVYRFTERANPRHYVTVQKERTESFFVPVDADFDFVRPAGSNNYSALIDVGKRLAQAYGVELFW